MKARRWLLLLILCTVGCLGASEKHPELRKLINTTIDFIEGHGKVDAKHIGQHMDTLREHRLAREPGIDRRKLALEIDFLQLRAYLVHLGFASDEFRAQHRKIMDEYFVDLSNHYFYLQAASDLVPWQSESEGQVDIKNLTNKIYDDGIIAPEYVTMLAVASEPRLLLQQALMFGVMGQTHGDDEKTRKLAGQIVREVKDPFALRAVQEYLDFVGVSLGDSEMATEGASLAIDQPSQVVANEPSNNPAVEMVYFDDLSAEREEKERVNKQEEEMANRKARYIKYIGIFLMILGAVIAASSFTRRKKIL